MFEAFRAQITRFDLGQPYEANIIQGLYDGVLRTWVELGILRGGAFVDWASLDRPQEVSWIRTMPYVPDGLLLRFVASDRAAPPEPISDMFSAAAAA